MYDTINLYYDLKQEDEFKRLIPLINPSKKEFCYGDYREIRAIYHGHIEYLNVTLSPNRICINNRSFCKWLKGDNLQRLTLKDIKEGIEKLSKILNLPMDKAIVSRVDIGLNIIVRHPVEFYLSHLGTSSRTKRLLQSHGLYYHQTNVDFVLYDKLEEFQNGNNRIPEKYTGKNLLRIELRIEHNLNHIFKKKVTAGLLYDKEFYSSLVKLWADHYYKIHKINDICLDLNSIRTINDFRRAYILILSQELGGELEALDQIEKARKSKMIGNHKAYNFRQKIISAYNIKNNFIKPDEAIEELDQKIKDCVATELGT
ncbi:phage/plasmid replication domain-containing protein [Segatella asaccharophila]